MEIVNLRKYPEGYDEDPYCDTISELDEGEIDDLRMIGVDTIVYWYAKGDYAGAGQAIVRANGKWYYNDLVHCSCYGPTKDLRNLISKIEDTSINLSTFQGTCSSNLWMEVKEVHNEVVKRYTTTLSVFRKTRKE